MPKPKKPDNYKSIAVFKESFAGYLDFTLILQ